MAAGNERQLLDTVALVWAVRYPERLRPSTRRLITAGPIVVSVVSYWEVVIKTHKGLFSIPDLPAWWERAVETLAAEVLAVRSDHVNELARLPRLHGDPFDRMLVAQTIAERLTLVTNDEQIQRYSVRIAW